MHLRRGLAYLNPANYYVVAGIALLGLSIYVPLLTAARTARIEERADHISNLLLAAASEFPLGIGAADVDTVLARFYMLAGQHGAHTGDLEEVTPPLPHTLVTLQSKHYAYYLAESPPEVPSTRRDTVPSYEVVAWPLTAFGPAQAVFFISSNAQRAYTRNLSQGYSGLGEQRPVPGLNHRRSHSLADWPKTYYSRQGERWIVY